MHWWAHVSPMSVVCAPVIVGSTVSMLYSMLSSGVLHFLVRSVVCFILQALLWYVTFCICCTDKLQYGCYHSTIAVWIWYCNFILICTVCIHPFPLFIRKLNPRPTSSLCVPDPHSPTVLTSPVDFSFLGPLGVFWHCLYDRAQDPCIVDAARSCFCVTSRTTAQSASSKVVNALDLTVETPIVTVGQHITPADDSGVLVLALADAGD